MSSMDSGRNISPVTSVNSSLQERKRVRYYLPQGALIGGIYEVEKPLGHGGMGEVYLARHVKLDIHRAVKILLPKIAAAKPAFAVQFMQEARLAIQLQHPNIINVMDANYDEKLNVYYIVMELVDGASIRSLIRRDGPFGEKEALGIALDVGRALEEADRKKIVHRDIKPDNIMLTKDKKVKLADLGIAKSPAGGDQLSGSSRDVLIGTPAYVSPEQIRDAQLVDCRADIYSLGVSLYEMLTGEKPYKGVTSSEIVGAMLNTPVPDVRRKNPTVGRKTAQLVMKMMAKKREDRPRNWTILCASIEDILGRSATPPPNLNETQATVAAGIMMDADLTFAEAVKPKLRKSLRIAIPSLAGFIVCLLLMSGIISAESGRHCKRGFILFCMGEPYRSEAYKYGLYPPWDMAFASPPEKASWLNQHKPKPVKPPPVIIVKPDPDDPTPPNDPGYQGHADFVFELDVNPAVEEYIRKTRAKLQVTSKRNGGTISVEFDNPSNQDNRKIRYSVRLRAGRYTLHLGMDGCHELPDVDIDVKRNESRIVKVVAIPRDGKVKLNCKVANFEVWHRDCWLKTRELQVASLENQEVAVRAPGYRTHNTMVKLQPGEEKTLSIALEPLPDTVESSTDRMIKAEAEYGRKNYAAAKKLYLQEAETGNRIANYRLGEIFEKGLGGLGDWFPNMERAYRYYRIAADKDYAPAMFKVGEFHENGLGNVAKNEEDALQWYRRGAELENPACLNRIGKYYETGRGGVATNLASAIEYYQRGAVEKDRDSMFSLGLIYEQKMISATNQKDREKFRKLAHQWYEKAKEQGVTEAGKRMRNL